MSNITTDNMFSGKSAQEIADHLNDLDRTCTDAHKSAVAAAIAFGNDLIAAKEQVGKHGAWYPFLEQNCKFTYRHAQKCMQLARKHAELPKSDASRMADLTFAEALKAVGKVTRETVAVEPSIRKKVIKHVVKHQTTIPRAEADIKSGTTPEKREREARGMRMVARQMEAIEASQKATGEKSPKPKKRIVQPDNQLTLEQLIERLEGIADKPNSMIVTADLRGVVAAIKGMVMKSIRREVLAADPGEHRASDAMHCASIAISQLERIREDDPLRLDAMKDVYQWIAEQTGDDATDHDDAPDGYEVVDMEGGAA